ncbi:hypothetical protein CsatA_005013 [Cannabis sativa]
MALFSNLYLFHGSFREITNVSSPWIEGKDNSLFLTAGCVDFAMFVLIVDHLCEETNVILRYEGEVVATIICGGEHVLVQMSTCGRARA